MLRAQNKPALPFYMYTGYNDSILIQVIDPALINKNSDTTYIDTTKNSNNYKNLIPTGANRALKNYKKYSPHSSWIFLRTDNEIQSLINKSLPKELVGIDSILDHPYLINPGNGNTTYIKFRKDLVLFSGGFEFEIFKIKEFEEYSKNEFRLLLYQSNETDCKEIIIKYSPDTETYSCKFIGRTGNQNEEPVFTLININNIRKFDLIVIQMVNEIRLQSFHKIPVVEIKEDNDYLSPTKE
jgi:hypothetical protein